MSVPEHTTPDLYAPPSASTLHAWLADPEAFGFEREDEDIFCAGHGDEGWIYMVRHNDTSGAVGSGYFEPAHHDAKHWLYRTRWLLAYSGFGTTGFTVTVHENASPPSERAGVVSPVPAMTHGPDPEEGARTPEEVIARAIVAALPIEDLVAFVQDPEVRHVISLWVDDLIDPAPLHMGGPPPVFRDGSPVVVDPDGWRRDNRP